MTIIQKYYVYEVSNYQFFEQYTGGNTKMGGGAGYED